MNDAAVNAPRTSWLDAIHGTIERRILLNYRIDPEVLARALPRPFRPKLHQGHAVGGVCMIRFRGLRPPSVPEWLGLGSENAAHRFAVEWEQDGVRQEGVFIPRRDTGSAFNRIFGGRLFPGLFQRSRFEVSETRDAFSLRVVDAQGGEQVSFKGRVADRLPATSIFQSVDAAAGFFSLGATGYSAAARPGHFHGMELRCLDRTVLPLEIESACCRLLSDDQQFPAGSVVLDCALLMREVAHEWHSRPDLHVTTAGNGLTASPCTSS